MYLDICVYVCYCFVYPVTKYHGGISAACQYCSKDYKIKLSAVDISDEIGRSRFYCVRNRTVSTNTCPIEICLYTCTPYCIAR